MKTATVLGLSWGYHDAACAIVKDGNIIAASQEERYTRKKFDSSFPKNAIHNCLRMASLSTRDIDCVAYYEDPQVKLNRVNSVNIHYSKNSYLSNYFKLKNWITKKLAIEKVIYDELPSFNGSIFFSHHHKSHAASAFFPSPFKESSIVVIDGIGEWACTSIGFGENNKIKIIKEQRFPHSLGFLYSAFTQYLGFKVNAGEYKVMGLAPYGKPIYIDTIKDNIANFSENGVITIDTQYFDFITGSTMVNGKFCEIFGNPIFDPKSSLQQKQMDIASSIQKFFEQAIKRIVAYASQITKSQNLVMAGGVALNCVANGEILKDKLFKNVWIQPAAGDAGSALGAALLASYDHFKIERVLVKGQDSQKASLLGDEFSNSEIEEVLKNYNFKYYFFPNDKLFDEISELLIKKNVIGIFQGKMEFGPRALGSRSIIADPRIQSMQKKINLNIKFRESFRPFAPIVKEDKANQWFDILQNDNYMLFTADVLQEKLKQLSNEQKNVQGIERLNIKLSEIPAVTHVNGSARLQTINSTKHPYVYKILDSFETKTDCPVLVNTSFNIRGEPIVRTPLDALRCFMNTNMDILVLENFVAHKSEQTDQLIEEQYKNYIKND